MRTRPPLLAPIFRSEGQARLLAVTLLDGEHSLADLAARADVAYPTAHREVKRLLDAGIFAERTVGRMRLIRANESSPMVPPLTDILRITEGPVAALKEEIGAIKGVESAFIYGSFAARLAHIEGAAPHDVDVMIVGTPDSEAVYDACARVEDLVQRPVNPTILSHEEAMGESGFLDSVRHGSIVNIVGTPPWQ